MRAQRLHQLLLLGSVLPFASGCVAIHTQPVVPLPVQLASPTPVVVHIRARGDTAATSCRVWQLSGTVAAVRGDTMEFAAMHHEQLSSRSIDCLGGRPGYILLSSAPDLQAESVSSAPVPSLLLIAFTVMVFMMVFAAGMT